MSTVPANSSFELISPLALRLSQFLALKHAMGYRYREEGRALRRASTVPPGKIMLAVLPFENLTGDPDKEYLADGLTEETISQLGRLNPEQLGVVMVVGFT